MPRDNRDYAIDLLDRTSKELGIDFGVDCVDFNLLPDSAAYYFSDDFGSTIYVPKTYSGTLFDLKQLIFHECGHSWLRKKGGRVSKYLENAFGLSEDDDGSLKYFFKTIRFYFKDRESGYCSGYSMLNAEEDFCETLSFVLCNYKKKGLWKFDGEVIDYLNDEILFNKVNAIKRLLKI